MRTIGKEIMIIIWSFILGDVLGYIAGQLEGATVNYTTAGIVAVVVALLATNCISLISKPVSYTHLTLPTILLV